MNSSEIIPFFTNDDIFASHAQAFENSGFEPLQVLSVKKSVELVTLRHPRVIVIETDRLVASENDGDLKLLREAIEKEKVLILVLFKTFDDIARARVLIGNKVSFFSQNLSARALKKKVLDLLGEYLFLESPKTMIVTQDHLFQSQLEMVLKNYGMRVAGYNPSSLKDLMRQLDLEIPDIVLFDSRMNEVIGQPTAEKSPFSFFEINASQAAPEGEAAETNTTTSFTLNRMDLLVKAILNHVYEKKKKILHSVRDTETGLYVHEAFIDFLGKEISYAAKTATSIAVVDLAVSNLPEVKKVYGELYTEELINNLGSFIRNRVRVSDVLSSSGDKNRFYLLLPRQDDAGAKIVGERIKNAFHELFASAKVADNQLSVPNLDYQIKLFDRDFDSFEKAKVMFI